MNVFPPILTNRVPLSQSQQQPPQPRRVHFETGDRDLECPPVASSSAIESSTADSQPNEQLDPEKGVPKRYFKYRVDPDVFIQSPTASEASDYVENGWSDVEEGKDQQRSREAQEAEIKDSYRDAFNFFRRDELAKAVALFTRILTHPLMQTYHLSDWSSFDWEKALKEHSDGRPPKILSNMAKIYFTVNLAMIGLVENPVPFYMQALSIRPDFKDLWYNCAQTAARNGDWRSAEFCLSQCKDEFRALEAMLLANYLNKDFLGCTAILQKTFQLYPEHTLSHVLRKMIAESSPVWNELHLKIFGRQNIDFPVDEDQKRMIVETISKYQSCQNAPASSSKWTPFQSTKESVDMKYAQLQIKLQEAMKMEKLGQILCDVFDRIEAFSSFVRQRVVFEMEQVVEDIEMDEQDNGGEEPEDRETTETSGQANSNGEESAEERRNEPEEPNLDQEELTAAADGSELMEKLLEQIANTDIANTHMEVECAQSQAVSNSGEELSQDENAMADEQQIENTSQTGTSAAENNQEDGQIRDPQQTKKKRTMKSTDNATQTQQQMIETDEEIFLRRSIRLVEDVFNPPKERSDAQWTVLDMMGYADEDANFAHELSQRRPSHFSPDSISPQQMPPIGELLDTLVKDCAQNGTNFLHHVHTFLKWIACDQPSDVILSLDEVEVFRQLYSRWTLFASPVPKNTSELGIHQLAAELGSHRALSVLQAHYGRKLLQSDRHTPATILSRICAQSPPREQSSQSATESGLEENGHSNTSVPSNIDPNGGDLLNWVFHRIAAERQQTSGSMQPQTDKDSNVHEEVLSEHEEAVDEQTHFLDSDDDSRRLEIRYKWLTANLLPEELGLPDSPALIFAHSYSQLSDALKLIEPEWSLLSHAEFEICCLTKRNLEEVRNKKVRQFLLRQIDYLTENKRYTELKDVFCHHYDWKAESEDAHAKQMFLLIKCFQETGESFDVIGEWINRILANLCHHELIGPEAKQALRRSLQLLDELFPDRISFERDQDSQLLSAIGHSLGQLVNQELYPYLAHSLQLWIWCYKIAKFREGELTAPQLADFYETCSTNAGVKRRLPTKALMVLVKGHEILGQKRRCANKEGIFIRFILEEIAKIINNPVVRVLLEKKEFEDVRENTVTEVHQCLRCCLSEKLPFHSRNRSRFADHGSRLQWPVDWSLAQIVLPLIAPLELPEICSDRRVSNEFVDAFLRAFGHLVQVDQAQLEKLDALCKSPFKIELLDRYDSDGLWSGYEDRLEVGSGMQELERESGMWAAAGEEVSAEERNRRAKLGAQCLYLVAHFHHRTGGDMEKEWLRKCLAIGHGLLPASILASAWYAFGRSLTYEYTIKTDVELLEVMDAYVFPFKMALFLHWHFAEAHLDLGTLLYQLRTRFMRFKEKEPNKDLKRLAQQRMDGMLQKCQVYFRMAKQHDDSPKDVAWLTNFFLAKISEKLGYSPETVMDLYYRCALELEEEGIQYLPKINRTKQTYFEPLEIHYKVHAYAIRFLKGVLSSQSLQRWEEDLAVIHAYLVLFTHHGVQNRAQDGHWSAMPFYEQQPKPQEIRQAIRKGADLNGRAAMPAGDTEQDRIIREDAFGVVDAMVGFVDRRTEIEHLCRRAFETIMQRFPHYKACYRIAEIQFGLGNKKACADIIFDKLFLTGRKQKCNNFLENVVEIKRSDFERNGTFPYHLNRIVNIAAVACYKCSNIGRLRDLIVALTAPKPAESSREMLNDAMIRELLNKCAMGFRMLASRMVQGEAGQDIQQLGKLIEQIENVVGRLKKDERCQKEKTELETLWIACIRRRDKLSSHVDDDVIPLESGQPTQLSRFSNLPGSSQSSVQRQTIRQPSTAAAGDQNPSPTVVSTQHKVQTPIGLNMAGIFPNHNQTEYLQKLQQKLMENEKQKAQEKEVGTSTSPIDMEKVRQLILLQQQMQQQIKQRELTKRPYQQETAAASSSQNLKGAHEANGATPLNANQRNAVTALQSQQATSHSQPPPQKRPKPTPSVENMQAVQNILKSPQFLQQFVQLTPEQKLIAIRALFEKVGLGHQYVDVMRQSGLLTAQQTQQTTTTMNINSAPTKQQPKNVATAPKIPPANAAGPQTQTPLSSTSAGGSRMSGLPPTAKPKQRQMGGTLIKQEQQSLQQQRPSAAAKTIPPLVGASKGIPKQEPNQQMHQQQPQLATTIRTKTGAAASSSKAAAAPDPTIVQALQLQSLLAQKGINIPYPAMLASMAREGKSKLQSAGATVPVRNRGGTQAKTEATITSAERAGNVAPKVVATKTNIPKQPPMATHREEERFRQNVLDVNLPVNRQQQSVLCGHASAATAKNVAQQPGGTTQSRQTLSSTISQMQSYLSANASPFTLPPQFLSPQPIIDLTSPNSSPQKPVGASQPQQQQQQGINNPFLLNSLMAHAPLSSSSSRPSTSATTAAPATTAVAFQPAQQPSRYRYSSTQQPRNGRPTGVTQQQTAAQQQQQQQQQFIQQFIELQQQEHLRQLSERFGLSSGNSSGERRRQ